MRDALLKLSQKQLRLLSDLCFILGFISILGSIFMWYITRGDMSLEALAHAERFGIFVGLWAPTFLFSQTALIATQTGKVPEKAFF